MKKASLAILTLILSVITTQAQVMGFRTHAVNFGIKAGVNYPMLLSAPFKSDPGPIGGLYVRRSLGKFGFRIEALGSMAHYTTKYPAAEYLFHAPGMDTITKGDFQVIYVHLPVMGEYKINSRLMVLAGLQYNHTVSITDKNDAYTKLYGKHDILDQSDFAVTAGLELNIVKRLNAGIRFTKGVMDVNTSNYYLVSKPWTTASALLTVGYRIL